jgi:predicted DNA-binding transcriptional regulator AlpA
MTQSATKFEDEIAAGDRILTAAEVAAYARIGLSTLRQYLYAGCGPPGFKSGAKTGSSRWKFRRADVDAWLDASRIVRRPRPANVTANTDAA